MQKIVLLINWRIQCNIVRDLFFVLAEIADVNSVTLDSAPPSTTDCSMPSILALSRVVAFDCFDIFTIVDLRYICKLFAY